MRRKNIIMCSSEDDMDRKAESLSMQGFHVEREIGVMPAQGYCVPIYRLAFWK